MSQLVVSGGTVIDPGSELNAKQNVLIQDGRIFGVVSEIPTDWSSVERVDATDKWVLPGLICLRSHVGEPGNEWKETIASASLAAAAGGFTTICATPDSSPVNDISAVTEQILAKSKAASGARILPVGAASVGLQGKDLTEMANLLNAGCVAISTGEQSARDAAFLRRILEYAGTVGVAVFTVAEDNSLTANTVMHEGQASIRLGMNAVPAEAEAIGLYRDAMMASLTGVPLHVQKLSTEAAVTLLRKLQADGVPITASVTGHHLWFDDREIAGFNTSTLVRPPLRSNSDVDALRKALNDGVISAVVTDHHPQSSIEKAVEYQFSEAGTTALESTLGVVTELVQEGALSLETAIASLTSGPAQVLGRSDLGRLAEGCVADLVVVDPNCPYRVESKRMQSKSRNCIFEGTSFSASVSETIVDGALVKTSEEGLRVTT
ncbi:MAG TPA: dihydroorotase [Myxococcales bacterium]|nr:dihydroorotase [Myxococcales bacterium]